MKVLLVTAFDSNYFELGQGTVLSIRDQPRGKTVDIAVLNLGLSAEQTQWLQSRANFLIEPKWDFDFPNRDTAPGFLRLLLARPFLRQYFPGYDVYVWIDADAWVQDWEGVDLLIRGALRRRGMAVSVELHRASQQQFGDLPYIRRWIHETYARMFQEDVATALDSFPMINAGVFALHHEAPHWELWRRVIQHILQRDASIMTDQFALNFVIYTQGLMDRTEILPEWCNWIPNGFPAWDPIRCVLTEPYLPHQPIGIVHMAGNKLAQAELQQTTGGVITIPMRYPEFRSFVEQESK
ncbi:MAG: hypothetical protein ABL921_12475 [Pirellula sp.]